MAMEKKPLSSMIIQQWGERETPPVLRKHANSFDLHEAQKFIKKDQN